MIELGCPHPRPRGLRASQPRTGTAASHALGGGPEGAAAAGQAELPASSPRGYLIEMGFPPPRHRALSAIQLRTGTFSYHAIGRSQFGQRDLGATTDCPAGHREMHTLRK